MNTQTLNDDATDVATPPSAETVPNKPPASAPEDPPEISDVIGMLSARVNAIMEKANLLVQIQADSLKLSAGRALVQAGLGLMGFLVAAGLLVFALALVLTGVSYALGNVLGGRIWLSHLIIGTLVLTAIALAAGIGIKRMRNGHFKKTRAKYATQNF